MKRKSKYCLVPQRVGVCWKPMFKFYWKIISEKRYWTNFY